jgi:hypothetical protein
MHHSQLRLPLDSPGRPPRRSSFARRDLLPGLHVRNAESEILDPHIDAQDSEFPFSGCESWKSAQAQVSA